MFNRLNGGADAHARNLSILMDTGLMDTGLMDTGGRARPALLYDVAGTLVHDFDTKKGH